MMSLNEKDVEKIIAFCTKFWSLTHFFLKVSVPITADNLTRFFTKRLDGIEIRARFMGDLSCFIVGISDKNEGHQIGLTYVMNRDSWELTTRGGTPKITALLKTTKKIIGRRHLIPYESRVSVSEGEVEAILIAWIDYYWNLTKNKKKVKV